MGSSLLMLFVALCGGILEVQTVPWRDGESTVLVADFDRDGRGEVGVITGKELSVYESFRDDPVFTISLPDRTSLVDVFDADQDGTADIIVVSAEEIIRIPVTTGVSAPRVCFSRENQYSRYRGIPFPGVLIIMRQNTPLVALPCMDRLELRTLDGELVDSYLIGVDAPHRLALGQPFNVWTNQYAQLGSEDALEFRISSVVTYKPLLADKSLPLAVAEPSGRLGTPRQQREATTFGPDRWPWYPVSTTDDGQIRALYARTEAPQGNMAIRIRRTSDSDGTVKTGPVRHFPGLILRPSGVLPDFNGDGFHDLLLWKSKRVSPTVDGLARAVTQGAWPLRIIAHAYVPEKIRYSAKPMGYIEMEIPLAWYIASGGAGPLRTIFLHDINGDSRTDFGCLVEAQAMALWCFQPKGFPKNPDFTHRFPEPIDAVVFETDLEGQGCTTIALRSQNHLYLLRPDRRFAR